MNISNEIKPALDVVAYFFRFHTDASLKVEQNKRGWMLLEGKPPKDLEKEGEVRLLIEANNKS